MRTKRSEGLEQRPINRETFIEPWPEAGLTAARSPHDPAPSLRIADGVVEEMDGVARQDFDLIDHFIARHALDLEVDEASMATPSRDTARMLVDVNVSRSEILKVTKGCTAAI